MPDKPPKVPRRAERPVYGLKTAKNYPTANAVEVILAVPKARPSKPARYVEKSNYGKVPGYLSQVKADIEMEKEVLAEFLEEAMPTYDGPAEDPLPERERQELIKALKRKWDYSNKKFQGSLGTDSKSKIDAKEYYEKLLAELEKDIKMLSRGPVVVREDYY